MTTKAAPETAEPKKTLSMEERLLQVRLAKEELELENLQFRVDNLRAAKAQRKRTQQQNEQALQETRDAERQKQENCNHRMGGEGLEALLYGQGSDDKYSVLKHTYPWGETRVMCTRCGLEWKPGDKAETHPSGISYKQALNLPTWNRPSGTQLFLIPRLPRGNRAAAS